MRKIGVVSVGRSDYGPLRPILRRIAGEGGLELALFAGGTHLSPAFGLTIRELEADGWRSLERVATLVEGDSAHAMAHSMARALAGFADAFARRRPDVLLLLGDRYEMLGAGLAGLALGIPLAHVHGGELTEGAMDDAFRHSLSKLSHLHFPATEASARRLRQLGEEPWRISVSGAPSLDELAAIPRWSAAELARRVGIAFEPPPLLVTFHPVTLEPGEARRQAQELLAALARCGLPAVFTAPNADAGSGAIIEAIRAHVAAAPESVYVENLGKECYVNAMARSLAMVGNSSSGIIEAASFGLPVVNVGERQKGRERAANVIDVPCAAGAIESAIRRAAAPAFRAGLAGLRNPYGEGEAGRIVVERLKSVPLDAQLLRKRFIDA